MKTNNNHLILLTVLTTTNPLPIMSPSPSPLPSQSPPTPTPTSVEVEQQLNNIIDALIGASDDFTTWVSIISMSNPTTLPLSATLFISHDNPFFHNNHPPLDPFLFPYHVVPQRLTFSDLLLLPPTTRLPTLLPERTISVTNNSADNFSLDCCTPLTHPDLYSTHSVVVHGIANLLDYSLFGDAIPSPPPPQEDDTLLVLFGWKSGATSSWCTSNMVFLIFCCCFLLQQLIAT